MKRETFHIANYIRADESFHFARKDLARRFPDRAHDHDYFEVFLVVEGRTQHWINGEMQRLTPGQMTFVRPSDTHALKADPKLGCEIINVMFRVETAAHLLARYHDTIGERFFAATTPLPELHSLGPARFERAVNVAHALQTADRSLARVEEFLLTMVNRVADVSSRVDGHVPGWFAAACSAAQSEEVFREGAAGFIAACGRSHEHVCRVCQEILGLTPTAYVNRIRIEHAAHLLRSSDIAIDHVAETCGFETASYFYRLFRRQYGTTPRAYRLRHQRSPF